MFNKKIMEKKSIILYYLFFNCYRYEYAFCEYMLVLANTNIERKTREINS